ncbi:MAG: bifunctional 4-hydroxy-2-oxoglutarate aldolase/2-dehydro-3-deoxy-phosphogluconate aldolase [Phyllobacteriaceae bacterium]|jgi:2-dehydro-3-deoxyphosphogluconate aldolase/(4S)-4-hydroxy-2-oxoglutarate aldolase|nr:bifunctional 4-hydroxy-2-oxoglutarate aldolase/2-dehydro-3-deoxy-phosphogluconate aldolase [Phyllobacteriaceae bacterium]
MTMDEKQNRTEHILRAAPVVPVMVIEELEKAVPLARALVKGGLPVLEITLRTPTAVEAIRAILAEVEGAIVGAGTVLNPTQLNQVAKLGCAFAVSPGSTGQLLGAAEDVEMPLLPGGVTASEVMALLEWGYRFQKFFPAEPAGGTAALSSLASPIPQVKFCPTGGITPALAPSYLKLPNVITLGGSWMVPKALVAAGDWAGIEKLAREAAALK